MSNYKYLKYKNKYNNLKNNMVGGHTIKEALQLVRTNNINLTSLNLCYNNTFFANEGTNTLAIALEHNNTLLHLILTGNNIDDIGTNTLAIALEHNNTLLRLDLAHNNISDIGANALARVLEHNNTLLHLILNGNNIGDIGTNALTRALEHNNTLLHLDLTHNNISDIGANALARVLEHNNTLLRLDLINNNIGDIGAQAIAKALNHNTTLTTLTLHYNNISDIGLNFILSVIEEHNFTITLAYIHESNPIQERIKILCEENKVLKDKFIGIFQKVRHLILGMSSRIGKRLPDELWDLVISEFYVLTPRELKYYTYLKTVPCLCGQLGCDKTGIIPCFIYNMLTNSEGKLTHEELSQTPLPNYPLSRILLNATGRTVPHQMPAAEEIVD